MISAAILFLSLTLVWLGYKSFVTGKREANLPPGPPTLPLLGNIHLLPKIFSHLQFTKWARDYGEIYSVKLAHTTLVVLNSTAVVKDLMDKHGATTGDRPSMYMSSLAGEGLNIVFMSSKSELWKEQRKAIKTFVTPKSLDNNLPAQRIESIQMLHDLLQYPNKLYQHVQRVTFSSQYSLVYGKRAPVFEPGTEVDEFYRVLRTWETVNDQSAHPPIDLIPIFKLLPTWTGLAKWRELCEKVRIGREKLYVDRMMGDAEKRWEQSENTEDTCYMQGFVKNLKMDRKTLAHMGASMMEAGSDTTASFMLNFIAALLSYPEIQTRAQKEIDEVIGDRVPSPDDFSTEQLPYLNALIKEVFRFRPVFPLGIPHATTRDEVYNGYVIPKGATILINVWGIHRDPDVFEDPDTFNPERYLKHDNGTRDGRDFRMGLGFGAGRRQCPAEAMALRLIRMNTMNILWGFQFTATEGSVQKKDTLPIDLDNYCTPGIELAPHPFTCKVIPRSDTRADAIRGAFAQIMFKE